MRNLFKIYTFCIILIISLTSCSSQQFQQLKGAMSGNHYKLEPLNIIPMYGAPEKVKTERLKKLDREFIESIEKSEGSREVGAKRFATAGWIKRQKENWEAAMMRFNQAWLLDPKYYGSYWGFGTLMLDKNKPEKASGFLEKSLLLMDDNNKDKTRLLTETARSYGWYAAIVKSSDSEKAKILYEKANRMIDEALNLDSKNSNAYRIGGIIAKDQGDYTRAWDIVKKSRDTGAYKFDDKFIGNLSKELPEP